MGKLFGTDGIRGVVNDGLDAMLAFRVGMAAAQVMTREKGGGQPRFTIGKDTRISSDLLEGALIAGLCSAGADVLHLGVIPTPAVAWITVDTKADAGIVISASHNPFEHNGIKIFNGQGFKLSDELEGKIEEILLNDIAVPLKTGGEIGRVIYADEKESQDYIDHLVSTIGSELAGLHILVDCANGAASATAARLFDRFPDLHTDVIHADPDGVNINNGCGSTHLDQLKAMVKAGGYDLGIAFDGDADRCLAVDERGQVLNGDKIMYICAKHFKERGQLPSNTLVTTVMSNFGLYKALDKAGIRYEKTAVGDRYVYENMKENDFMIGGEQSGHIIFRKYAHTGDGLITALMLMQVMIDTQLPLSVLAAGVTMYPQVLKNVRVDDKDLTLADAAVQAAVDECTAELGDSGRVLLRKSGTEPVLRVMAEAGTAEECEKQVDRIIAAMEKSGHLIEVKK